MGVGKEMKIRTFSKYLKERFGLPVKKIAVHTHFGCPHRGNRVGDGGCFYCNNKSFGGKLSKERIDIQIKDGISEFRRRGFGGKFIVYYQSYTNTYAPIGKIKKMLEVVDMFQEDVVGISVASRPDCVDEDILFLFDEYAKRYMFWLELGLQSASDKTLSLINRGHNVSCFIDAVKMARKFQNILLCAHIILGLPGETTEDMKKTIYLVKELRLEGIKIHHLQVLKDTVFERWFYEGKIKTMSWQEYLEVLLKIVPLLGEDIIIHRLVSDAPEDLLIAPKWNISKAEFLARFYSEIEKL